MHGKEYGEAKWGDIKEFNKKFADMDNPSNNKIFSENIRFKYDSSTLRNNNTFVVGGSGSGKTSFFLTPNLLNYRKTERPLSDAIVDLAKMEVLNHNKRDLERMLENESHKRTVSRDRNITL